MTSISKVFEHSSICTKTNENLRWKHLDFGKKRRDHLATEGIAYSSTSVDNGHLSNSIKICVD